MNKNLRKFSFFLFNFILFVSIVINLSLSIELDESWRYEEGVIYNNQSTIWPFYVYEKCPQYDVLVNSVNKRIYPLLFFSRTNNSHVSLPANIFTQRSLCVAINNVSGVEIVQNSSVIQDLDVYLYDSVNSHLNVHGDGSSPQIFLQGINSNNYIVSTKIQRDPPDLDYSCVGSINGNDFQGYHFGDCNYNPLRRIWISLKEDFKVWLEATSAVGNDYVKVEVKCDGFGSKCDEAALKLYHSNNIITSCPADPELYIYNNNYSFVDDGWVCGMGIIDENRYSITNLLEISVLDFWISSNISSLIRTSSLSTKIELNTNKPGYCEYSLNSIPFTPFVSDISQYGIKRYSMFHETLIQLKEEYLEQDIPLEINCYEEDGSDVAEKDFLVRLTNIDAFLSMEDDLIIFKGQTKLFDLSIKDEYDGNVYGLKSNQFETKITSQNNDVFIGISGVTLYNLSYKFSLNAQLDPGVYNITINCINGINCEEFNTQVVVKDSTLTILNNNDIKEEYDKVYSLEDIGAFVVFTGDDIYYNSTTGTINSYEGFSLYVVDSNIGLKDYINLAKQTPTYIVVNDETIAWIIEEYTGTRDKLLLRYIGRDENGNKIIKVEYIE